LAQIHTHFVGDDVGECGFPEAGGAKEQHVVERFLAITRSSDKDLKLIADPLLPDVLLEGARTQRPLDGLFVWGDGLRCDQARSLGTRT
jgi:hypothetical protein